MNTSVNIYKDYTQLSTSRKKERGHLALNIKDIRTKEIGLPNPQRGCMGKEGIPFFPTTNRGG